MLKQTFNMIILNNMDFSRRPDPPQCGMEIINGQRVYVHKYNMGEYACRCGLEKFSEREDKTNWHASPLFRNNNQKA